MASFYQFSKLNGIVLILFFTENKKTVSYGMLSTAMSPYLMFIYDITVIPS